MEETKNRKDIGERSAERTSRFEVQVEDVSGRALDLPGPKEAFIDLDDTDHRAPLFLLLQCSSGRVRVALSSTR